MKTSRFGSLVVCSGLVFAGVASAEFPGRRAGAGGHRIRSKPKALICKALPHDSDKDGIPDGCDRCPNTPKGTAVGVDGCPLVVIPPICGGDTQAPGSSGWSVVLKGGLVDDGSGGKAKWVVRAFFYLGVKDTCEIGQLSGILQAYWGETKLAPVVCKGVPWTRNEKFSTYEKAAVQSGFFECVAEVRLPGGGTAPADAAVKKPVKVGGSLWATDGAGNSSGWTIPSNGGPIDADLSCSFAGGVASCERTNLAGDPLELCKKGLSKQVPKLAWSPHVVAIVVPHDKKTLVAMAKPKIKIDVKTISVAAPSIPGCSIGPKIEVEAVVRSDNGKPIKMFSTEAKNGNCVLTPKPAPPVGSAEMTLSCSGPAEAVVPVKKGTTFSYEILIRAKNAAGNVSQKVFKGTVKPSPAW